MEYFTYDGNYYSELIELCDYEGYDKDLIDTLPDDFEIECRECDLEPIIKISPEWVVDRIELERFSENRSDDEMHAIETILNKHIDFDKINSEMPKMYYENRTKIIFTKQDLLDAVS